MADGGHDDHDDLEVLVTISMPQLSLEKTVSLHGFHTRDGVSRAVDVVNQFCADLCEQQKGHSNSSVGDFEALQAAALEKWHSLRQQAHATEQELTRVQARYSRNVDAMARMRASYLRAITKLKQHIDEDHHERGCDIEMPTLLTHRRPMPLTELKGTARVDANSVTSAAQQEPPKVILFSAFVECIQQRMQQQWIDEITELRTQLTNAEQRLQMVTSRLKHQAVMIKCFSEHQQEPVPRPSSPRQAAQGPKLQKESQAAQGPKPSKESQTSQGSKPQKESSRFATWPHASSILPCTSPPSSPKAAADSQQQVAPSSPRNASEGQKPQRESSRFGTWPQASGILPCPTQPGSPNFAAVTVKKLHGGGIDYGSEPDHEGIEQSEEHIGRASSFDPRRRRLSLRALDPHSTQLPPLS
eukprot:gnl/TRDRNA2_/TRDRNA2_140563_c0_seq6.p1 gnl/TRDRNA2_/TRDRNA2_140563_c0~~gnl/TRDRNA2_/TRDRNA2_140563_c0_seq6.p1  ORF type:complete len:469 (+),score=104.44 gnl/TRDRNA2_/TRDRNA2_140563_c0_seq6:164-1408(+)